MRYQHQQGFTLIELICCLAIFSIVVSSAAPAMNRLLKRSESTVAINWIVTSVVFARTAAIYQRTTVTLCPSRDGASCGGQWHEGMIAFTDHDQDRRISGKDRLLKRFEFPVSGATLRWRAFQNRPYLQMTSHGFTDYQNGNFVYCPADNDVRFARQLVINVQGRTRLSSDIDGDGIVEDTRGRDLNCP